MRILLVEDDPMIADAVKSALADEAHAVDHVSSGRTALTQLGLSDYQLVLLDLGLPGLDGMSVLRTLRGEGSAKKRHSRHHPHSPRCARRPTERSGRRCG